MGQQEDIKDSAVENPTETAWEVPNKCGSFNEVFGYDEWQGIGGFGYRAVRSMVVDGRYSSIVLFRLAQYIFAKSERHNHRRLHLRERQMSASGLVWLWFTGVPKLAQANYVACGIIVDLLSQLNLAKSGVSISPMADIGRGIKGSMRNIGITAMAKVGENFIPHGNITVGST